MVLVSGSEDHEGAEPPEPRHALLLPHRWGRPPPAEQRLRVADDHDEGAAGSPAFSHSERDFDRR